MPSGFLGLISELGGPLVAKLEINLSRRQQQNTKNRGIDVLRLNGSEIGGAEGNRTPDLCSAIAALSHLSYGPKASGVVFTGGSGVESSKLVPSDGPG